MPTARNKSERICQCSPAPFSARPSAMNATPPVGASVPLLLQFKHLKYLEPEVYIPARRAKLSCQGLAVSAFFSKMTAVSSARRWAGFCCLFSATLGMYPAVRAHLRCRKRNRQIPVTGVANKPQQQTNNCYFFERVHGHFLNSSRVLG